MNYRQPFEGDYPITQKYGEYIDGVTIGSSHTGIDYACPQKTPILASADGIVMSSGWDYTGFGYCVIIKHDDTHSTLYAHLAMVVCKVGQKVKQSEIIAYSGSTGKSTGPHLHFEARKIWNDYKSHFDPMDLPMVSFWQTCPNNDMDKTDISASPAKKQLKGADYFRQGDCLTIQNEIGVYAFHDPAFSYNRVSRYQQGTQVYYTGDSVVRKDNGLTYMRVVPAQFTVWIAVNDGETQLLDR